uniref:Transmembrane protein 131 n=1 Tax=Diabrotica virgifera virgifera TaxID=50390 RepID=A0A6P7FQJ0_DIAVI
MFSNYLPWYIFTLSLLELIIKTHPTLHDSSHGFISKNPRYFDEEFSHLHEEFGLPRTSKLSDVPLKFHMKFEPTFLDFKKRPFGIPHMEKVTLFNIDKNKSIDMTSISGSTVHFHSSFFADRNIPPKGNTSFNVVFLGREEGYIESDLYIHTSEGFLKYNVRGASTYSHYRIRPIGVKLPLNSTFAPLIFLHNPHLEPLQIVEVHGEGGGFHLELPNGESEGAKDLWKLDPHETKAIIRVFIQPEILQNYTAYVRIRLNKPDLTLVVPVEVEVTEDTEIIHPSGYVDLGLGGHLDHPTEINLCLHNPNTKHVRVHSIYTESKALKLQYYNIRLPPARETEEQGDQCVDVGTIIVDWKTAYETKDFSGKITVSYRNGKNKSEIPYHMTILKGGLTYDPLTTTYFINDKTVDLSARSFKVKNEFDEYIYVADVIFPRDIHHYFKIQSLWPKVIKPGDETNLFNIKLKNNIRLSDLQLQSFILLKTNISHVRVSLVSYNGKLQVLQLSLTLVGAQIAQWLKMFSLSKFVYDFDLHLVNTFYNRYLNLTANGTKRWQNISMRLDTSEVRGHVFKSRLKMSWPSLLVDNNLENKSSIVFPRTQVGNMSYHNITIRNPASVTVVVQLVLGSDYPNYLDLLADMPPNLDVESIYDRFFPTGFFFPNDTRHEQINYFNEMLGVNVHPESIPVLLPPGETFTFPVGFYAEDGHCHSAVVLLRNNLTILEVVRLNAKGVQPLFKFGNRKPGSLQPLTFEMTERHFRDCEKQKFYTGDPNFTVKRTFTARNIGDVTLYVNSFHINEYPCEGYGFKVMDCESFVLYPNQTKKIDIAFTPDLTLSKISRMLQLGTSLNMPVNYTLYTTIPPLYLSLCSDLIARPNWEVYLSYLAVVAMSLLLFIIVSVATLDAERIKRQAMDSFIFPSNSAVQPVLDLRLVGQQIREEIQSQKPVTVSKEETKSDQVEVTKEEVPEVNSKPEVERYTVLVPTTGKAKKKLAKRNSNESSPVEGSYMQMADKVEKKKERHPEPKHKVKETKDEKEVVKVDEKEKKHVQNNIKEKEVKKSHFHNKKHTKNTVVPAYEEETSSSTTESSGSLNEDPEKENNQRISVKVCSKTTTKRDRESQKTSTTNGGFVDGNPNHTNEFKHVHFNHSNHHNKLKHQKLLAKAAKANEKQIKENKDFEEHHKTIEHALSTPVNNKHHSHQKDRSEKKKERISKERKEKGFHKKSLEKNKQIHNELTEKYDKHDKHEKHEKNEKHEKHKNPLSFNVPLPTPMTSTVWGESRAKFSDVVARSESSCSLFSNNNRPLSHTSTAKSAVTKPTMYVEPYKQTTPTELGPIGSRRTDRRSSSENRRSMGEGSFGHDNFLHTNGLRTEPANSFFSDEIRLDNVGRENGYLGDLNTWNQQQTFGSALEPGFTSSEANTIMEEDYEEGNDIDPWNQNLLNTSSYWESYNPLLNDSPLLPDTPLLNENSLLSEATNALPTQNNVTSASNVYLWGSSSVWQPWAPETTRTPTRTPPGFDEFLHRKDEQSSQQPQQSSPRESYSPFNISPLWNQQQTNPWNYSQGQ